MQIRINGSANLSQVRAEFAALEAQVTGLNAAMAKTAATPIVNPKGYQQYAKAVQAGGDAWRNSLASTGLFRVEQMKLSAATEHYTDLLQRQKLSFRQVFGKENRALMRSIYEQQLKLHDLQARPAGKNGMFDIAVPMAYNKELDTSLRRMNMLGAQLKSAGTHMVNFGKNTQWAGRQLTVGLTMPVVALGAASAVMAYKVDQQMTRVRKVYNTTANQSSTNIKDMMAVQKEFADLNKASWSTVTDATKQYGAAASDTLGVQADLAATGMTGMKLQKATTQVMKSAMLGEIDYQTATSATIALQQQLHLSTKDLADSWSYMNSVENSTSLQMKDFAAAIPIALGPIRQMGGDLQDLGTLMTAMISRGVQVGKAANAIKALPQRLSRPSKQVQQEFKTLTGQDIVELNKKNPNNIIGLLTDIENATKNLDTLSRRKALAGLFGTFQLSTMTAMLQGMDDLANGIGQTTTAFNIGQQSAAQWAQVSDQEIGQMQKSLSQRFKTMVNEIKNASVEFGRPFLEVGIQVGNVVANLMDKFSAMPKAFKLIAAGALAVTALAGPTLMLVGLFGNLAGSGLKVAGSILSMGKALVLATAEEKAMTKAHQEEQAAMSSAGRAIANQTLMTDMLRKAKTEAAQATIALYLAQSGADPNKIKAAMGEQIVLVEKGSAALLKEAEAYRIAAAEAQAYHESLLARAPVGARLPAQSSQAVALNAKYMAATQEAAILENAQRDAAKNSVVVATNTEKTKSNMVGASVAGAAMALSMGTMMITSNKTANSIAQWVLISTIIVPAVKGIVAGVTALELRTRAAAVASKLVSLGFANGLKAIIASINPIGAVLIAATAIGVIAYKVWQHNKKITEEHNRQSDILSKQNSELNDQLGIRTKMARLTPSGIAMPGSDGTSVASLATVLQKSKSGKELIKTYQDSNDFEKQTLAAQTYMDALRSVGGTADKARQKVEALMLAAGEGSLKAETQARTLMQMMGPVLSITDDITQWGHQMTAALDETSKAAEKTGDTLGKRMADAIANGGPGAAAKFMDGMQQQLDSQYQMVFSVLPEQTQKYFRGLGINSAKVFDQAIADYPGSTASQKQLQEFADKYKINVDQVQNFMQQVYSARGQLAEPLNNINNLEKGISKQLSDQLMLAKTATDLDAIRASWAFKLLNINKQNAAQTYFQYVNSQKILDPIGTLNDLVNGTADAQRLTVAQQAAQAAGLKVVNSLAEQERILSEAAKGNFITSNDAIGSMSTGLAKVNALLAQSVSFTKDQVAGIQKTAMGGVTEDVASGLQAGFDARQKAAQDSLQKYWDNRLAINDRNAERETRRLENKWTKLHDAADKKWERRKDAMTEYWDKRIQNVDKAIEAEQKADEIRQAIFEAEKTRIERLNQMANTNIDFNVAVNSGNLDEAAKIRNDMQATAVDWALSDAGAAGGDASKKRVDALNNQKDLLEKQKDTALKNLADLEKANQASLDKREKQEKAHLDRMQKARADALKRQEDTANAALASRQAREAAAFDQRLTLFKSYIARDQKDLENWMTQVGLSYDKFGENTKAKGESWSTWFQNSMVSHMQQAGRQVMSDNMWTEMGKEARKDMLHAMGFKSLREFGKFIQTGNLPSDFGSRDLNAKPGVSGASSITGSANKPHVGVGGDQSYHVGGEIGVDAGGRNGIARSLKGLHPSEMLINAQKGEFMVNRRAAQKHKPLLQAMNNGQLDSASNVGFGVGGDLGVQTPGIAMGTMAAMMVRGIANAMIQKKNEVMSDQMASLNSGALYSALKGSFGNFNAEQLANAAIIAEIGDGMGMSKRDIEIGIMTAITESGLRNLHSGDRDSQGLFQQRPSQGWGTVEQVTNPRYAANAFFSHLKAVANRGDMSPWMAAQTVQRSAFADGSNYKQYWDEAVAIFTKGLVASGGGFAATGGAGGYQRASIPGKGWSTSHDYLNGLGSPLFAADDGRIIESRAITTGGSPGNGLYSTPYRSYGETIVLLTKDGDRIRYAHLNPGTRAHTGPVRGGALIGRSGMTGNASGPHTHFEINGMLNAREWFKAHGIGLDTGGYTTSDGMANLHKDEVVIDPNRTAALYNGIDTFTKTMDAVSNIGFGSGGGTGSSMDYGISRLFGVGNQTEFTPATNTNTNVSPTTTSKPADSGKAFRLRTAAFNLFNGLTAAQQIHDLKELIKRSDAISLSEFNHPKVADWLAKQGWRVHDGHKGDTALAWNTKVLGGLQFGTQPLNPKHYGPAGLMHRYAEWGLFRDKKSGRQFYQASIHTVPRRNAGHSVGTVAQRNAIQKEQAQNIQKLYDMLRGKGKPVVMGGDINAIVAGMLKGDRHAAGNNTFQIFGNYKGTGSMDRTGWNSDHPAVYGQYNIPGLKIGGYTMSDGLANLHKNELVIDPARTKILLEGIDNLASGGKTEYNIHVNANTNASVDELVAKTMTAIKFLESRTPQSRRG